MFRRRDCRAYNFDFIVGIFNFIFWFYGDVESNLGESIFPVLGEEGTSDVEFVKDLPEDSVTIVEGSIRYKFHSLS